VTAMQPQNLVEEPSPEPLQPPGIELHSIDWVPDSERKGRVSHLGAGAIAVGRRADLAVLDVDVLAAGYAGGGRFPIADATVELTVAAGRIVHERQA